MKTYKNKLKFFASSAAAVLAVGCFSLSPVSAEMVGFFENKVFDDAPEVLHAATDFTASTNDTERLTAALNRASQEDADGGVVILRGSDYGENKRYRVGRVDFPSNVRLEVDPDVTIEMESKSEPFLFSVGRSPSVRDLIPERVRNVEITSTHPTERFTIDARTNKPLDYTGGGTRNDGSSRTRAIPIALFYVENFSVSNVRVEDNFTVSVAVQLYPDTNYMDGAYAIRSKGKDRTKDVFLDGPNGEPLPMNNQGQFVDDRGQVISDRDAIVRNDTWGRTPIKGTIRNILAIHSHTGYGAVQVYGGDWVEIDTIESVHGIGVRLEAGNGTDGDNMNRAGPYNASANHIKISNVTIREGFTGVWLKTHGKINRNVLVHNVTAIDSGSAILIDKGTFNRDCRDFIRGRYENAKITGDISLKRTGKKADVGFLTTFYIAPSERDSLKDTTGDGRISAADLPRSPSGHRWYLIEPVVPVLAMSQMSASEVGDPSESEGFYAIDFSQANITGENLLRPEMILYREDMTYPNGNQATNFILK
ncbi:MULTISPECIES: hypothetical protein [unclassified Lentimonas]|uniref:hypothetical protein n=1 Tax=unclassified Lentimonas TaxID=2630993 RepID=UPI001323B77A|nr:MULTISPECIES: hypothetical protein [unclassified Lentimonas]CAA6679658.1 Unannotated [Lentimonas sp. CC4]CAA6683575.1 Unannotated [Lentimonas sp. CC6]CAA7077337.1 Unannotated [Lentimonas sp. CC4]CAA7170147.1 Unannotated [Lentimonas sp. CC21]CAA7182465.1 Unannotated [Lentimonas sp. CC8]